MCALHNLLFYRDNLDILRNRDYFPDECVDLIYLDPLLNSSRDYTILFKQAERVKLDLPATKDMFDHFD